MENIQTKTKVDYNEKLEQFYQHEFIPAYVFKAGKSFITINISETIGEGTKPLKVTLNDVIDYYETQARSMSGMRCLAGHYGDWRNIDELAKECLEWFKFVNVETLRKESFKRGMTPKF